MIRRDPVTTVPILLYHSVADDSPSNGARYTVRPSVFCEHLRAIAESGRTSITVSSLADAIRGTRPLPARPVLITFDDGYADTPRAVEFALNVQLASSTFIATGRIGASDMITSGDVRVLAELGEHVEIGAHAVTHRRLDELGRVRAATEISMSRATIEEIIQSEVRSFAYPHGAYDRRVRKSVIDAGFTAAAAVKNALSHSGDDPFALARVTVYASTPARQIERLLAGDGARRAWKRERLRTRGYRAARRLRHSVSPQSDRS